jgi:hypothetical protein
MAVFILSPKPEAFSKCKPRNLPGARAQVIHDLSRAFHKARFVASVTDQSLEILAPDSPTLRCLNLTVRLPQCGIPLRGDDFRSVVTDQPIPRGHHELPIGG